MNDTQPVGQVGARVRVVTSHDEGQVLGVFAMSTDLAEIIDACAREANEQPGGGSIDVQSWAPFTARLDPDNPSEVQVLDSAGDEWCSWRITEIGVR